MMNLTPKLYQISETDSASFGEKTPQTIGQRIAWLRQKRGLTSAQLASLIGVSRSNISRWESGKQNPLQVSTAKIATALNTTTDWIAKGTGSHDLRKERPVVGYVGATDITTKDRLYPIDDYGVGDAFDFIDPPFETPHDTVVVIVKGNSQLPILKDGDYVMYRRDVPFSLHNCINKLCVVKTDDEQIMIKRLKASRTPGKFKLISLNAEEQDNIQLEWASPILGIVYR